MQRGTLTIRCDWTFIVLDPSQSFFPERATVAPENKRDKEHLKSEIVMLALGLGFFLVAVGYVHACERL